MVKRTVYIVDDDQSIRRSVSFMLRTSGFDVETFDSGDAFIRELGHLDPGCILLDVRMPGLDGLQVQQLLTERGTDLPVIIMTGHGDVTLAVRAMKAGAVDFIEKPFPQDSLQRALDQAWAKLDRSRRQKVLAEEAATRLNVLTARERQVLNGMSEGLPNKTIAHAMGISPRTVEIHRANLMAKLGVKSLSEALRIAFSAAELRNSE